MLKSDTANIPRASVYSRFSASVSGLSSALGLGDYRSKLKFPDPNEVRTRAFHFLPPIAPVQISNSQFALPPKEQLDNAIRRFSVADSGDILEALSNAAHDSISNFLVLAGATKNLNSTVWPIVAAHKRLLASTPANVELVRDILAQLPECGSNVFAEASLVLFQGLSLLLDTKSAESRILSISLRISRVETAQQIGVAIKQLRDATKKAIAVENFELAKAKTSEVKLLTAILEDPAPPASIEFGFGLNADQVALIDRKPEFSLFEVFNHASAQIQLVRLFLTSTDPDVAEAARTLIKTLNGNFGVSFAQSVAPRRNFSSDWEALLFVARWKMDALESLLPHIPGIPNSSETLDLVQTIAFNVGAAKRRSVIGFQNWLIEDLKTPERPVVLTPAAKSIFTMCLLSPDQDRRSVAQICRLITLSQDLSMVAVLADAIRVALPAKLAERFHCRVSCSGLLAESLLSLGSNRELPLKIVTSADMSAQQKLRALNALSGLRYGSRFDPTVAPHRRFSFEKLSLKEFCEACRKSSNAATSAGAAAILELNSLK